jgi:hypothetical protein
MAEDIKIVKTSSSTKEATNDITLSPAELQAFLLTTAILVASSTASPNPLIAPPPTLTTPAPAVERTRNPNKPKNPELQARLQREYDERQKNRKYLAQLFPELAAEWVEVVVGYSKTIPHTPQNTKRGSIVKVLWKKQCKPNIYHQWVATVHSRAVKGTGCPRCKKSRMEKEMLEVLNANKSVFKIKSITTNKFLRPFRIYPDFFIELQNGKNVVIEMDGAQHSRPFCFKTSVKQSIENFQKQLAQDHKKNTCYKQSFYYLLRIDYSIIKSKYEGILQEFFNEVNKRNIWFMKCEGKSYSTTELLLSPPELSIPSAEELMSSFPVPTSNTTSDDDNDDDVELEELDEVDELTEDVPGAITDDAESAFESISAGTF